MKRLAIGLFAGICLLAPFFAPAATTLVPTHTKYTFYTAQTDAPNSYHVATAGTIARRITLISGGGGGMGSQANMVFNAANPIPYWLYGKMGTESCWDTHPQAVVQFNGPVVTWPNHPFVAGLDDDNPMFFTTLGVLPAGALMWKVYYLIASTITTNTFTVSEKPYVPPGPPAWPLQQPAPFTGSGTGQHFGIAYKRCVTGGSGGGIIGDQGLTGHSIGTRFAVSPDTQDWFYQSGGNGDCAIGGGGRGGGDQGAITQYGTLHGNRGNDLGGGGGSGGGMGQNYTVIGPCGGGTGATLKISVKPADMKQYTYFLAGKGADGGAAGPRGWAGGPGGNGSVVVEEDLP